MLEYSIKVMCKELKYEEDVFIVETTFPESNIGINL